MTIRVLTKARTELGKCIRRNYKDDIGVPMTGRKYIPSPHPWANTVTSISKDNYLLISY